MAERHAVSPYVGFRYANFDNRIFHIVTFHYGKGIRRTRWSVVQTGVRRRVPPDCLLPGLQTSNVSPGRHAALLLPPLQPQIRFHKRATRRHYEDSADCGMLQRAGFRITKPAHDFYRTTELNCAACRWDWAVVLTQGRPDAQNPVCRLARDGLLDGGLAGSDPDDGHRADRKHDSGEDTGHVGPVPDGPGREGREDTAGTPGVAGRGAGGLQAVRRRRGSGLCKERRRRASPAGSVGPQAVGTA